jgi:methyltransferase (TIGR00027 family)
MIKQRRKGRSAYGAAMMKALEAHVPSAERLFDDSLVGRFLPARLRVARGLAWVRDGFRHMMERGAPGVVGGILCRTRYIDDVVCSAVAGGIDTIVVLGAGLDTRASLRLRSPLPSTAVA